MDTLKRIKNLEKNINLLETVINTLVKSNKELHEKDKQKDKEIQTLKTCLKEIYKFHAEQVRESKRRDTLSRTQEGH